MPPKVIASFMRYFILVIVTFASLTCGAQDSLDNMLSKDVCHCLSQTKGLTIASMENCFQSSIAQHREAVTKYCFYFYKDTSEETGRKFGVGLVQRLSVSMIATCQPYYKLIDSLRYAYLSGLNKNSIKLEIEKMSRSDTASRNADFFSERGVKYFQIADLDNALSDFSHAIKMDENAYQSIYFKAWTLERKGDYDKAILLYHELFEKTNKSDINIMAEIAKRKKTGL